MKYKLFILMSSADFYLKNFRKHTGYFEKYGHR